MATTCWKTKLKIAMEKRGENLVDLVANTLTDDEMKAVFDDDYGGTEGIPFAEWTEKTVYFPLCYDGAEWVGSVSRHPDGKPTEHQGGG